MNNDENKNGGSKQQNGITPYAPINIPPSPYIRYIEHEPEKEVHLRDYLNVILRRKWVVLIFLISVIVTTAIFTFTMIPVYQSTAVIKIEKGTPSILSLNGSNVNYDTQYEILKSRSLAAMVVKNLNLTENKNFLPVKSKTEKLLNTIFDPVISATSHLFSFFDSKDNANKKPVTKGPIIKEKIPRKYINTLIKGLGVTPVKKSQLVKISFESQRADIAFNVANALAETYIEYDLKSRIDSTKEGRIFLQQQIEEMKKKIENSEKAINKFASRNKLIFLDNGKVSLQNKDLTRIANDLNAAKTRRLGKEALYKEIKELGTESTAISNNSLIQGLQKELASLKSKYLDLSRNFTPDYPEIIHLKTRITALQDTIKQEMDNFIKSVESDYNAALKQENNLKREFALLQKKKINSQGLETTYNILTSELELNKGLLNDLLKRYNETGVAESSKATSIQIIDRALYPNAPYKPNKQLNFLLSIVFGLMGGIGLVFLMEYFDNTTIRTAHEVEKETHLPTLGMIPFQKELKTENRPMIVQYDPANPIAEAFRSISTFIYLSSSSKPPKSILVTSPVEKEGKTTICVNIASALTESLGKGIIIDADLRKPRIHHSFQLDNETGLSTYLSGNTEFEGLDGELIKPTGVKGLSIMTSGPVPPNPSELLLSSRMKDLLTALYTMYNFVIIDAAPILGMSDSVFLSTVADGTILVVKAGETPRSVIEESKRILNSVHASLLGVVLNGVKMDNLKYGYYSSYASSYFKK